MKTRTGFVSNSSSSSFVLIGKEVEPKTIKQLEKERRDVEVWASGKCLYDGMDIFCVTDEHFQAMLDNNILDEFTFYRTYGAGENGCNIPTNLEKGCYAEPWDWDMHSSQTVDELLENYEEEIKEAKSDKKD